MRLLPGSTQGTPLGLSSGGVDSSVLCMPLGQGLSLSAHSQGFRFPELQTQDRLMIDPVLSIAFCYHGDFALHLLMTERLLKENLDNGLFETKITVAFVTS